MLATLLIRNFVLIEDASLEFAPGLTVLTGETGAGKTLLTQALGLLLGEKGGEDLVGPRGEEALIQAVFDLSGTAGGGEGLPEGVLGEETDELIAVRRLGAGGRGRCFLNGMVVPRETMAEALKGLLAFTAQQEHRRLLDPGYQRALLDAFAGEEMATLLERYRTAFQEWRRATREVEEAERTLEAWRRERELLEFEVGELEAAALSEAEEQELQREQALLARAEEVVQACAKAAGLVSGEGDTPDALGLVGAARVALAAVQGIDPALDRLAASLLDCEYTLRDAARALRRFAEEVVVDPARRDEVDARLRVYTDMGRKYGGSTGAAVERLENARRRLAELNDREETLEDQRVRAAHWAQESRRLAEEITAARLEAAPRLEQAVTQQLSDLDMSRASFSVRVQTGDDMKALTDTGRDDVEFFLASNPGLPPRSLAKVASGGELSRTLLAVKCAVAGLGRQETLVFDEIDAGIGGRTALAVGEKLRSLSRECQVVVITHLPQVAAYAERHYLIDKVTVDSGTMTRLVPLDEEATLRELCRMLGGRPEDAGAMAHARALRSSAREGAAALGS